MAEHDIGMKKELLQKKLDGIAYWYGLCTMLKVVGICMSVLIPPAYAAVVLHSTILCILFAAAAAAIIVISWKWCTRLKKKCPRCGRMLKVERTTLGFTDTYVFCEYCNVKSDKAQLFECSHFP